MMNKSLFQRQKKFVTQNDVENKQLKEENEQLKDEN